MVSAVVGRDAVVGETLLLFGIYLEVTPFQPALKEKKGKKEKTPLVVMTQPA
jgi:hypothetical protein